MTLDVRPALCGTTLVLVAAGTLAAQRPAAPSAPRLRTGIVITRSLRAAPGTYRVAAPSDTGQAAITIRGDNITLDLRGVTLLGADPSADPDAGRGIGILVDGGRNVRIRGARLRGYKVAVLVRGTRGIVLEDNDLGYNWKPRLFSGVEHESLVDWLSHHHNEQGEWLRFGAGAYLTDVRGGEIRANRIEQGMEGLMLVRSDSLRVWNNVIEFNSGVGIGLYRSSDNTIVHNHVSYNVRGYSHGFYRRGQDSADLLLYEQSSRNIVAFNSMTHGGDGLFLWAGQSTMDTGEGGANDNLFYANDFSFAPTNAMEATFSRNRFIGNRAEGSDHGLWGGYSFDSEIRDNTFGGNRIGIAIEHGQNNLVARNRFAGDSVAINLWANAEPADWAYPRHRDTRSRDYRIIDNHFTGNRVALRVAGSRNIGVLGNRFDRVDTVLARRDSSDVTMSGDAAPPLPPDTALPHPLPDGLRIADDAHARDGRAAMIVDEWGPYDWRSPKLWPAGPDTVSPLPLRVLGPPGNWRVAGRRGIASLSAAHGSIGDTIIVTPGAAGDWELTLEYHGQATVSPRGVRRPAGVPYRFSYSRFEPAAHWQVQFFAWADSTDPRTRAEAFQRLLAGSPLLSRTEPRLDYMWYRPTITGLPPEHFAAVATTSVDLAPGEYTLRTISDDAVRVWVDGRLAVNNWKPHESLVDHAPLAAGRHDIRVEYVQVDGWAELRVEIVRGSQRSDGSPGPH
ncbi:MAG: right-handed parallel beta-helix repeat-containing protein [Bacillota bacterium]